MLQSCEIVRHTLTHLECSDFVICQFGLSANQLARVLFVYGPIQFKVCRFAKKKFHIF